MRTAHTTISAINTVPDTLLLDPETGIPVRMIILNFIINLETVLNYLNSIKLISDCKG